MLALNAVLRSTAPISSAIETNRLRKISRSTELGLQRADFFRFCFGAVFGTTRSRHERFRLFQFSRLRSCSSRPRSGTTPPASIDSPRALLDLKRFTIFRRSRCASPDPPPRRRAPELRQIGRSCLQRPAIAARFRFVGKIAAARRRSCRASTISSPCCGESNQKRWTEPALPSSPTGCCRHEAPPSVVTRTNGSRGSGYCVSPAAQPAADRKTATDRWRLPGCAPLVLSTSRRHRHSAAGRN